MESEITVHLLHPTELLQIPGWPQQATVGSAYTLAEWSPH